MSYSITTRRPRGGPISQALAEPKPGAALARSLVEELDARDGWTWHDHEGFWWFPSRLALNVVGIDEVDQPALVRAQARVVVGASLTEELVQWLSDLNAHATGWSWWFEPDDGSVYCTMSCVASPERWWWPWVLHDMLPHAVTVAESMADQLARASSGDVCSRPHPQRGLRDGVDGWIQGVRLGSRDPAASLDRWLFEGELDRMGHALGVINGDTDAEVQLPLDVRVHDEDGVVRAVLRRFWHPQQGWGWQLATLTGLVPASTTGRQSLQLLAGWLNAEQAGDPTPLNRFGGWTCLGERGLVHLTFVPAFVIDSLLAGAGPTIGDVAALMLDVPTRLHDASMVVQLPLSDDTERQEITDELVNGLGNVGWQSGPIGWSYVDAGGLPQVDAGNIEHAPLWTDLVPADGWTVPRHHILCSFGIFNPMGPTVSSLEVAMNASADGVLTYSLYFVMRHPHTPEVVRLGDAEDPDDLAQLVYEAMATNDHGILGAGPDWLDIFAMPDPLLAGVRQFAAGRDEVDWRITADLLMTYPLHPWARISAENAPVESPWPVDADPIDCWIDAVTNRGVIAGHQLFVRSSWEGARAYRQSEWDPERAQQAADLARGVADERLEAELANRQLDPPAGE